MGRRKWDELKKKKSLVNIKYTTEKNFVKNETLVVLFFENNFKKVFVCRIKKGHNFFGGLKFMMLEHIA